MIVEEPKALDESMASAGEWGDNLSEDVIARMRAEMKKRGHDMLDMADYDVDLFVIGGGSGGVRAARIAARAWRARHGRGGISPRRHLRHPRLRAEKASGLRLALPRRIRGCRRLRLDRAACVVRLDDADRQQGPRDRAARSGLWRDARQGRRQGRQKPGRARRRPHRAIGEWRSRARGPYPDLDRRRRRAMAIRFPASSTPSPRTRRFICRNCRAAW